MSPTADMASASFMSSEPGDTFQCSVEGAGFKPCSSPFAFAFVGPGLGLEVRALDAVGNWPPPPRPRRHRA